MTKTNIEDKLMEFDFSRFSKVKESLREELKMARRRKSKKLSTFELDEVVAAGQFEIVEQNKKLSASSVGTVQPRR